MIMSQTDITTEHAQESVGQAGDEKKRTLLKGLAWVGIWGFLGINSLAFLRFFYPRVLFEPPSKFKVGFPSDYPPGQVNTEYQKEFGTWIIRLQDGRFFAMESKCTHLGCTPSWMDAQKKFKCPCHGSGYYITGLNFEGPAPRPMDRFKISLAEDGQLLVDKTIKFAGVPGKESNNQYPQSLLKV